jgi:hypothetical protein
MNPAKLLASRNILMASGVFAVAFVAVVLLHSYAGPVEAMPQAESVGIPPAPSGAVIPLDTLLDAYKRSRATALRQYRHAPFQTKVETVTPVNTGGWAQAVTVDGGRATLYFTENQGSDPTIAAGQPGTFICADWQTGPSGTMMKFGCGAIPPE